MVRSHHIVRDVDLPNIRSSSGIHNDPWVTQDAPALRQVDDLPPAVGAVDTQFGMRSRTRSAVALELVPGSVERMFAGNVAVATSPGFPARYRYGKRLFDLVVASLGLIFTAPLIAILGILVRLDSPGPAFFFQSRVGFRGRLFSIIKLRTMVDCDEAEAAETPVDDDRDTRIGRHLRRWSLDELPQLINVVRGEMSLVGPRPELPEIALDRYEGWQYQRFLVPQGMTGWWQITDRGTTRLCDDTEDDLEYVAHASFVYDLRILLRTLPAVIRQAGVL
jgi:lipopolysaccharide/colanic/teichoic acid biosynthesis glycosyltransferase